MTRGDDDGARARMRRFVGVSLGGGRGKTTAVARVEQHADGVYVLEEARVKAEHRGGGPAHASPGAFRDAALVQYLRAHLSEETVVAIDAPLTLPPCIRCDLPCPGFDDCEVPVVRWMRAHAASLSIHRGRRDPGKPHVTPYTQRATEILLEHATLQPREALGQGMGPLAARAAYLRRVMSPSLRLHENLLEVHPRATLTRLFGRETERATRHGALEEVWEHRKRALSSLVTPLEFRQVWPELVVRNPNVFYAVVGAISASRWAAHGWRGPGDLLSRPAASEAEADAPVDARRVPKLAAGRGVTGDPARMRQAIEDLDDLWMEDGWIWTPPVGGADPP